MSAPFLGEIRCVAFLFPPRGWAYCDGQLLPINQNQALFSILGTTYGGDGITTFALPDLRGRVPANANDINPLGAAFGETAHSLALSEMPQHTHTLSAVSDTGATNQPAGNFLAQTDSVVGSVYGDLGSPTINMAGASVTNAGSGQAHPNLMPYLTIGFIIALQGIFPSRN